jgi:hypothetical protein
MSFLLPQVATRDLTGNGVVAGASWSLAALFSSHITSRSRAEARSLQAWHGGASVAGGIGKGEARGSLY